MKHTVSIFLLFLLTHTAVYSQKTDTTSRNNCYPEMDGRKIQRLHKRYEDLDKQMKNSSVAFLEKLKRKEDKFLRRLKAVDSIKAKQLIPDEGGFQRVKDRIHFPMDSVLPVKSLNEYVPGLDTLNTAVKTLLKSGKLAESNAFLSGLSKQSGSLQQQFTVAGDINQYAAERVTFLKEQLGGVISPKELKALNKQLYYYRQSFSQYKQMLQDEEKLQKQIVSAARKIPGFQEVIQKNSWLAALFPVPENPTDGTLIAPGSQSLDNVAQQLAATYGSGSSDPTQYMQQQVAQVQAQTNSLAGRLNSNASSSGDVSGANLPEFLPNTEKGKRFWKRVEYGFNMQFQKAGGLLPVSTDIGLNAGYRFSQNLVAGLGAAYKIGWGNSLSHIKLTSEGVGLRSYMDIKAYKSLWMVAAWEYNYLQRFADFHELKNLDAWQKSAMAGISKKIKQGKRMASAQLLYDFLANSHHPYSNPLLIRFGYTL